MFQGTASRMLLASASILTLSSIPARSQQPIQLDPVVVKTPLDGVVVTSTKATPPPTRPARRAQTAPSSPMSGPVTADDLPAIATPAVSSPTAIEALSGSSAVDKNQIDTQFQPDRIGDVLQTIPGVSVQQNARDTAQAINIRGLQDFGRVNVLIDGMRQNFQRSGHNANGVFYIEPEMVKAVDITRGPTATIYGSGAIGGVAAFEVIDADDILRAGETTAMRLKARYSTNGQGMFGSSSAAARIGNFDIVGQLNGRDIGLYKDGDGVEIADSDERTTSGLAKARWRRDGHQITTTYIGYDSSFTDSATPGSPTRRDSTLENRQYNVGYTFSRPDSPLVNFSGKIYRNETDLFQTKLVPPVGSERGFNVVTDGIDVYNTSKFDFGHVKWLLTYGADAFEDRVKTFDQDPGGNSDELTPSGKRTVSGAFVQSHLKMWGMLDIIGALRYDAYEMEGGTTELSGDRVSPKVTVGVTPIRGITLFGTYAEGYRAPAVTEALIEGFHPGGFAFRLLPNPNLRPEVAHNVEGGVNLKYDNIITTGDAFRAKVVAFENKVDDYIDGVYSPSPPPFGQYQYQNIAKAKLSGVELEAAYDARRWFVGVNAARIRGENKTTGDYLLTVPADQLALTAGVRAFDQRLILGSRVRFVAAQERVPTGTPASEAYNIVDLFAQYNHTDDLAFNLNIDNLFDQTYLPYRDQENSPGLNARLGVTMRLGSR